jgi:hypothetical protein
MNNFLDYVIVELGDSGWERDQEGNYLSPGRTARCEISKIYGYCQFYKKNGNNSWRSVSKYSEGISDYSGIDISIHALSRE